MNDKIDVLAVVDSTIKLAQEGYIPEHHEVVALEQARAAIAELIEADREYDLAAAAILACTNKPAHTLVTVIDYADEARSRFEAAKTRRAAALARVGGA